MFIHRLGAQPKVSNPHIQSIVTVTVTDTNAGIYAKEKPQLVKGWGQRVVRGAMSYSPSGLHHSQSVTVQG